MLGEGGAFKSQLQNKPAEKQKKEIATKIRIEYEKCPKDVIAFVFKSNTAYDLVHGMFDYYITEHHPEHDTPYSHLWKVSFKMKKDGKTQTKTISGPYEGRRGSGDPFDEYDHSKGNPDFIIGGNVLNKGDSGVFRCDFSHYNSNFNFVVEGAEEIDNTNNDKIIFTQAPAKFDLTNDEKIESVRCRMKYENWKNSLSEWRRTRESAMMDDKYFGLCWKLQKPIDSEWTYDEKRSLELFIKAGHKFKKTWNEYLKFYLINRTEGSTSGQWYKEKKCVSMIERSPTSDRARLWVMEAKRLLFRTRKQALEKDLTVLDFKTFHQNYLSRHRCVDDFFMMNNLDDYYKCQARYHERDRLELEEADNDND